MTKIVAVDPILLFQEHIEALKKLGELVTYDVIPKDDEEIIERIKDADIVINFWTPFSKEVIDSLSKTKMICSASVGCEWIDVEAATEKGILICDCPGNSRESVAEHAIGLILLAVRHGYNAITESKEGRFEPEKFKGIEFKGRTIGIIGYGNIGSRIAEISEKGFGMDVLYTNSKSSREDLEKLLKESDFISVNASLNSTTINLLSETEFNMMKKGVVFINTARGEIVDEDALLSAIKNGKIYAAAHDVLTVEPFEKNHPLLSLPNVVVTPHIAWNTEETDYRLSAQVVETIKAYIEGAPISIFVRT